MQTSLVTYPYSTDPAIRNNFKINFPANLLVDFAEGKNASEPRHLPLFNSKKLPSQFARKLQNCMTQTFFLLFRPYAAII